MSVAAPRMRWWGWGDGSDSAPLPEHVVAVLRERLDAGDVVQTPVALDDVHLPEPRLDAGALQRAVGEHWVVRDRLARVGHAAGRSYLDLVRLRVGDASAAPDAVVLPGDEREVAAVLAACDSAGVAVVPFGGGTSVVGGVTGVADGPRIALDLRRLDAVLRTDPVSRLVTAQAGIAAPRFEAELGEHGLTFGHFPQSYEGASLGGYVATRSAGQASTGYGRVDELVHGLRLVAPAGVLALEAQPASAAGPSLLQLVTGSEGALGVITEATVAVHAAPVVRRYEAWSIGSFVAGEAALRALVQADAAPDVVRLSDEAETQLTLALGGQRMQRLLGGYLQLRGQARPCLVITGWEGEPDDVRRRRHAGAALLRRFGALPIGQRGGRSWEHARFHAPHLRDQLLDRGVLVETLETAARWSLLGDVYAATAEALRQALCEGGRDPIVGCHVSHVYGTGASLYFTVLARQRRDDPVGQWLHAKRAATEALLGAGGTLTHHHAVGRDHAPWLPREIGELGVEVLRAVKQRLDPRGIMNPGVLLPAADPVAARTE